jgi:hypothetical protein
MSDKIETAVRGVKAINSEIVQWENRLQFVQDEVKRLSDTKNAMQAEIDKKTADYNIYIAQKDTDSKRMRQDTVADRDQLTKDKAEFLAMLEQHKKDKDSFAESKQSVDIQNAQFEEKMNNVRQFIIAVQRAFSVLG